MLAPFTKILGLLAKIYQSDTGHRAVHTFWQSFSAAAVVLITGAHLTNVSDVKALALSVLSAAGASALSAAKTLVVNLRASRQFDPDVSALIDEAAEFYAKLPPSIMPEYVPGDPDQPAAGAPPADDENYESKHAA